MWFVIRICPTPFYIYIYIYQQRMARATWKLLMGHIKWRHMHVRARGSMPSPKIRAFSGSGGSYFLRSIDRWRVDRAHFGQSLDVAHRKMASRFTKARRPIVVEITELPALAQAVDCALTKTRLAFAEGFSPQIGVQRARCDVVCG